MKQSDRIESDTWFASLRPASQGLRFARFFFLLPQQARRARRLLTWFLGWFWVQFEQPERLKARRVRSCFLLETCFLFREPRKPAPALALRGAKRALIPMKRALIPMKRALTTGNKKPGTWPGWLAAAGAAMPAGLLHWCASSRQPRPWCRP